MDDVLAVLRIALFFLGLAGLVAALGDGPAHERIRVVVISLFLTLAALLGQANDDREAIEDRIEVLEGRSDG